jgi:hypothetical protein
MQKIKSAVVQSMYFQKKNNNHKISLNNAIMSFIIAILHQILLGHQNIEDDMSGICSTTEEIRIANKILVGKCEGKRPPLGVDGEENIETHLKDRGYGMHPLGPE